MRLIYPKNEDEANDWADEVGACVMPEKGLLLPTFYVNQLPY